MKDESAIFHEWLQKELEGLNVSNEEYFMYLSLRETIQFKWYLLSYRLNELIESIFEELFGGLR